MKMRYNKRNHTTVVSRQTQALLALGHTPHTIATHIGTTIQTVLGMCAPYDTSHDPDTINRLDIYYMAHEMDPVDYDSRPYLVELLGFMPPLHYDDIAETVSNIPELPLDDTRMSIIYDVYLKMLTDSPDNHPVRIDKVERLLHGQISISAHVMQNLYFYLVRRQYAAA